MKSKLTMSKSQIITVLSFEPVASFEPSFEKRQNQTSSQWSAIICVVKDGNWSLEKHSKRPEREREREGDKEREIKRKNINQKMQHNMADVSLTLSKRGQQGMRSSQTICR